MESKRSERYNIFVVILPPNLTGVLQPLDVAVNRSYQAFYRNQYDDYIGKALVDPRLQTKAGNPKVLHYSSVASWTLDWIASKTPDDIKKAFQLCGLVPEEAFDEAMLHAPLRDILSDDLDANSWHESYQHLLDDVDDREQLCISAPSWYLPDNQRMSLFYCLLHGVGTPLGDFVSDLATYMRALYDLNGLLDDKYLEALEMGEVDPGELEIYAASKLHNWEIHVSTVDAECKIVSTFSYSVDGPENLVRSGSYFGVKVEGYLL